jgi:hypothetical protein
MIYFGRHLRLTNKNLIEDEIHNWVSFRQFSVFLLSTKINTEIHKILIVVNFYGRIRGHMK